MKLKFIYGLILLLLTLQTTGQYYLSGRSSLSFNDPSRGNRSIPADIIYPSDVSGTNVALAAGTDSFPVVVFGHGFSLPPSAYYRLGDSIARRGYVVVLPATETGLLPSHENFGKDIAFLSSAVIDLNANATSFLFGRLIGRSAIGGHSMGGGCSFLAAAGGGNEIKALFNYAAAETNPSSTAAALSVNVPSLLFSGSSDCIVPPATQLGMYNNIPDACKTYINITGGTHCQISNNNGTCAFGEITSGCNSSSISVEIFINKSLQLLRPFLDYVLKGNCYRGIDFISEYLQITGVSNKLSNCPPPNCSILPVNIIDFSGQFVSGKVILNWTTTNESNVRRYIIERSADANLFSQLGEKQAMGDTQNQYSWEDLNPIRPAGYYRLKIINSDNSFSYSEVIMISVAENVLSLASIFPNPSDGFINLRISSTQNLSGHYRITAIDGRLLENGKLNIQSGQTDLRLSIIHLSSGAYMFELFDASGRNSGRTRFIKY